MERYERLRAGVLAGEPSNWRLGLGLLSSRGVAAWLRVRPAARSGARRSPAVARPVGSDEVVVALAAMALACVAGG